MKVIWTNHYHCGDLHVSRGFIRRIMNKVKRIDPHTTFSYSHHNAPNLLFDIPGLTFDPHAWETVKDYDGWIKRDDTIFINTWYGRQQHKYLNRYGITFDTLYAIFNETCRQVWGFSLHDISNDPKDFFPVIDYSAFELTQINDWLQQNPGKKVLIENGNALSGQAKNFSFHPIVHQLARKYPNITFILSKRESGLPNNVVYTDDVISKRQGSDLNEISYLSTHCETIIGRASGVFSYTLTPQNLFQRPTKYLCFSNLVPSKPGKFWLGPTFSERITYSANIGVYNTTNQITQLIEVIL